jgi:hypothetical protein
MSASAQAKFSDTINRLDALLDQRVRREEAAQALADADLEAARRRRQRANAEQRTQIQAVYADAYRAFGTDPRLSMTSRSKGIALGCSTGWRASSRPIMNCRASGLTILGHSPSCSTISSGCFWTPLGRRARSRPRLTCPTTAWSCERAPMRTPAPSTTSSTASARSLPTWVGRAGRCSPSSTEIPGRPSGAVLFQPPADARRSTSPSPSGGRFRHRKPRAALSRQAAALSVQPAAAAASPAIHPVEATTSRAHRALARRVQAIGPDRPRDDDAPPRSLARMVG